jgi:glucokinase
MSLSIGIDIGGTNLRAAVVKAQNIIHLERHQVDFSILCKTNNPAKAWTDIIDCVSTLILDLLNDYPEVSAVGIGFPGFIDPHTGVIAQSPNLPGLKNVNLSKDLAARINRRVLVENDALAAAYGEYQLNAKLHHHDLLYIGLGTGVGGGFIHAGNTFVGEHGYAMEIGHLITDANGRLCGCGNHGCLEQYASASGVSKSYAISRNECLSAQQIAELANEGDLEAIEAYALAGRSLAKGLAHIIKVIDVGNVVIGGGMSQAWPLMSKAFDAQLDSDLIPVLRGRVQVFISQTEDQAGIIGAALLSVSKSAVI